MRNFTVTLKGIFEIPVNENTYGELDFSFTCIIEADTPYTVISDAQAAMSIGFNRGVGFTAPEIHTIIVSPLSE